MTLDQMKSLTPESVDPKTLTDIGDVVIDPALTPEQKLVSFFEQIRNPYLYRCGKIIVKISYSDTSYTLEDRLEQYIHQRRLSDENKI